MLWLPTGSAHDSLVGIVKSATTSTRDKKVEVAVVQDGDNRYHVAHRHLFDLKQHVTCCVLHGVLVCCVLHGVFVCCVLHGVFVCCMLHGGSRACCVTGFMVQ